MKLLGIILSALLFVSVPQTDDASRYWDKVLAQYEALCNACLDHKPASEISVLSKELNTMLSKPVGQMTDAQKKRFVAIRDKYKTATGSVRTEIPVAIKVDTIRVVERRRVIDTVFVKEIIGQIDLVQHFVYHDTIVHVFVNQQPLPEIVTPQATQVVENNSVSTKTKGEFVALVEVGIVPNQSYGLMLGYGTRFGGYIKARSNFIFRKNDYECLSDGSCSYGYIWTTGKAEVRRLLVATGATMKLGKHFIPYLGAGYGDRQVYWEDTSGDWARVSDFSRRGFSMDFGSIVRFGNFAFSVGTTTTAFRYWELEAGLGVCF